LFAVTQGSQLLCISSLESRENRKGQPHPCTREELAFLPLPARQRTPVRYVDRHYEHINVTGVTVLTEAQKATLRALGAVEDANKALS
jgi:hypothetical protein